MEPQVVEVQEEQRMVGFPHQNASGGSSNSKWIIAIIGVVIIVIIGLVFILMGPGGGGKGSATPSPNTNSLQAVPTNNPEPTPEASPTPTQAPVDRDEVSIEVLNGTGKVGDAGYLKDELVDLGYSEISTGNADDQSQVQTTAIFSSDLNQSHADEITELLKTLYDDVRVRKQALGDVDIRITTGTRKQSAAATSRPTTSPTPKVSPTPQASPTATPQT